MRGGDDIDNGEVTIIADNGAYVGLGILTQDGHYERAVFVPVVPVVSDCVDKCL